MKTLNTFCGLICFYLWRWRERNGFSQAEAARRLGMPAAVYRRAESGRHPRTTGLWIDHISKRLGVDVVDIVSIRR